MAVRQQQDDSRLGRLIQTPGGILIPNSPETLKGLNETFFRELIPGDFPEHLRDRGTSDLMRSLTQFQRLLPGGGDTRELASLIRRTNAFDEYRISNNLGVTVVFDGSVHKRYAGETPLYVAFTSKGVISDDRAITGVLDEGVRLAEAMNRKNRLWDTPWDGGKTIFASERDAYVAVTTIYGDRGAEDYVIGKGGCRFRNIAEGQENQRPEHKKAVVEDWVASSITAGMLGKKYIAGPDMNMSRDMMKVIVDKAFSVAHELGIENFPLATTSRDTSEGGFDHFKWSVTSRGVVEGMLAVLRRRSLMQQLGIDTGNLSVMIQGFGDVGSGVAKILIEEYRRYGIKIVGISDRHGAIYDSKGLDYDELLRVRGLLERAEEEGRRIDDVHVADAYGGSVERKWLTARGDNVNEMLEQEATILVPAAIPNVVTKANVDRIKVKMIFEGANNAVERGLERDLHDRGILYFRGELMNGGGIYTSTDEFFHYTMEGERLRERVDSYRVHVLDGITDLAISNMIAVLDRWEGQRDRTLTDVVYEMADEMAVQRRHNLQNPTPLMRRRALGDVGRSHGRMPENIAYTIAASESAREVVAYADVNMREVVGRFMTAYSPDVAADIWGDYLDQRRNDVYIIGKIREGRDSRILDTLLRMVEREDDHPAVVKNAIEAFGNIVGWVPLENRTDLTNRADRIFLGKENHANPSIAFWSHWAREKMGYVQAA